MPQAAREREAWQALRRTQRLLHEQRSQSVSFSGGGARSSSAVKRIYCGYSPALAAANLREQGWDETEAASVIKAVILRRFAACAGSWNSYVSGHGFLYELEQLPPALSGLYEERYKLSETKAELQKLLDAGPLALANPAQLAGTIGKLNTLQVEGANGDADKHPALPALVDYHGLHPELARAVVLYQQAVPWWAIALIFFFAALAGLIFVGALVNPQSEAFNDGAGAGPAQYVAAPLFSIAFFAVGSWLWRDSPRRNAAWRAALERYRAA